MCQNLHNVLKSYVRDMLFCPPAFRGQIESDVYRPSKGGIDRLVTLSLSLFLSLPLSLCCWRTGGSGASARCCGRTAGFCVSSVRSLLARSRTRRNCGIDHGVIITITLSISDSISTPLCFSSPRRRITTESAPE